MHEATAQDLFNTWLGSDVAPWMKAAGWAKSGNTFRRKNDETVGVVQLTKSHWSRADHLWFWIKAGVWSRRLSDLDGQIGGPGLRTATSHPGPGDCHWTMWHSDIMHPGENWELYAVATRIELTYLTNIVRHRLDALVLPTVTAHMSDAAIRDALLAGYRPLQGPRLGYLYTLIAALGPRDQLAGVVDELRDQQPEIATRLGLG